MPPQSEQPLIEVRIGKVRALSPYDTTVAKAVAEAAQEALADLFRSGSRRRTFRLVNGTPAEGGLEIEAAIHDLALGEPRENAAMLTFVVVLHANNLRRRPVETGQVEGNASIEPGANPVPQAVRSMRSAMERGADRFVDDIERQVTRNR